MAEEQEEDENKCIRPRERARGQKLLDSKYFVFLHDLLFYLGDR